MVESKAAVIFLLPLVPPRPRLFRRKNLPLTRRGVGYRLFSEKPCATKLMRSIALSKHVPKFHCCVPLLLAVVLFPAALRSTVRVPGNDRQSAETRSARTDFSFLFQMLRGRWQVRREYFSQRILSGALSPTYICRKYATNSKAGTPKRNRDRNRHRKPNTSQYSSMRESVPAISQGLSRNHRLTTIKTTSMPGSYSVALRHHIVRRDGKYV